MRSFRWTDERRPMLSSRLMVQVTAPFKVQKTEQTNRQTDRQTDTQTHTHTHKTTHTRQHKHNTIHTDRYRRDSSMTKVSTTASEAQTVDGTEVHTGSRLWTTRK